MTFLYPMGLWALLAIPVIVGLHYFRHQKKVQRIGGLHLWDFARIATPTGSRFDRLLKSLPLLFQLLAALLLALLLAGLDIPVNQTTRHYAVVLDDSVSMQARVDGETSVKRTVDKLKDWAPSGARFTLLTAGGDATVIAGPMADKSEFIRGLENWQPDASVADFAAATNMAIKFSGANGQVLLVTDNPEQAAHLGEAVEVLAVGKAAPNNAIVFADRFRISPEQEQVVVTAAGFSGFKRQATLQVWHKNTAIGTRTVDLETSRPVSIKVEIPAMDDPVKLTLSPADSLAVDDAVLLLPSPKKPVRVYLPETLPQRPAFEKAVLAVPDVLLAVEPLDADLLFTTETTASFGTRRVYCIPDLNTTATQRVATGRDLVTAPGSVLGQGLSIGGVIWPFEATSATASASRALRADISYTSTALLYMERGTSVTAQYRWNLDLTATNIFRTTAWPILIQNIIEECRSALPGLARTNIRSGEDLLMNLELNPADPPVISLWRDGDPKPLQTWTDNIPSVLNNLTQGTYEIRQGVSIESRSLGRFRVNLFSPTESDLQSLHSNNFNLASLTAHELEHNRRNLFLYYALLILMIGCVILAWVYHDKGH